jgi:hypothetical protein
MMETQCDLTLDPDLMHPCQDRRNLKCLYKQLRSPSARTIFRQLTHLYFQTARKPATRASIIIGVCQISREQLEYAQMFGERLRIRTVGLLVFSRDVTASLVEDSIQSISVTGWVTADPTIRPAIENKLI